MPRQRQFQIVDHQGRRLLAVGQALFDIVGNVEGRDGAQQLGGDLVQLHPDLAQLAVGFADPRQRPGQVGHAAIIQRQRRVPGRFGFGEVALHRHCGQTAGLQFGNPGLFFRAQAQFAPGVIIFDQSIDKIVRVAQPIAIVEGQARRPFLDPAVLPPPEAFQQRGFHPPFEPGDLAAIGGAVAELHVEFGQHEEQHVVGLCPQLRPVAMGQRDPVVDQTRQVERFHVAARHAKQHRGDFLVFDIAVEQVGDLAAQQQFVQVLVEIAERLGQRFFEPVAGAGKVQKIGAPEQLGRLVGHREDQFGGQRAEFGARQGHLQPARRLHLQRRADIGATQPGEGFDVDDRLFARHQCRQLGIDGSRVVQPRQRRGQLAVKFAQRRVPAPKDREEPDPFGQGQRRCDLGSLVPERFERGGIGAFAEDVFDIFADLVHFFGVQPRLRPASPGLVTVQVRRQFLRVGRNLGFIAVIEEGIDDGADDVRFAQQAQPDWKALGRRLFAHGEAGDQAGAFALAFGIHLADIVKLPVRPGKIAHQPALRRPRQHRDQKGFAGLRRAEHADRHRRHRRGRQPFRPPRAFAHHPGERARLGPDQRGIFRRANPGQRLPGEIPHPGAVRRQPVLFLCAHRPSLTAGKDLCRSSSHLQNPASAI